MRSFIKIKAILFIFTLLLLHSCGILPYQYKEYKIAGMNHNVCKRLSGKVVVYAIFVDTKTAHPWTTYDINSTLDSIDIAAKWIESRAQENGISLDIDIVYHSNKKVIPLSNNLPGKTLASILNNSLTNLGVSKLNRGADKLAKNAAQSLPKDTATTIKTPNKSDNRERLIARLRDIYQTDNIALVYFINNYHIEDLSVALNTESNEETEYAIVSFKEPAVIAHEFLHLFGANDLYVTNYEKKLRDIKRKVIAMKEFPTEIMAFSYKDIRTLSISPVTKYLIGWSNELDSHYKKILTKRKRKLVKF